MAPFSEVTVSIWTSSILKESRSVHKAGGEQHLSWEKFLLTEVAVEDAEEGEEAPDHDDDHQLLVRVQLVPDLAGLGLQRPVVGALQQPLGDVTNLLQVSKYDPHSVCHIIVDSVHYYYWL